MDIKVIRPSPIMVLYGTGPMNPNLDELIAIEGCFRLLPATIAGNTDFDEQALLATVEIVARHSGGRFWVVAPGRDFVGYVLSPFQRKAVNCWRKTRNSIQGCTVATPADWMARIALITAPVSR